MKRGKKMTVLLLIMALLLCMMQGAMAANITMTAVNDKLLPLSDSTMPIRRNGEFYVPYTVFAGTLGVNNTMRDSQTLILYNLENTLTFDLQRNYVYDESSTSYAQPAYTSGGTIYVSVKLICRAFGLSFSSISGTWPILRIVNDDASLSDHAFLTNMESTISHMVTSYQAGSSGNGNAGNQTPAQNNVEMPVTPPQETEHIPQPERVYLTVVGTPGEHTGEILDALEQKGDRATFFLAAEGLTGQDAVVRRIYVGGHGLGLSFTAKGATGAALLQKLDQANHQLERACGVRTRLVMALDDASAVTEEQRSVLAAAGYRLWRTTLDGAEYNHSAFQAAEKVLKAFQTSNDPVALRLRQSKNTAKELRYVLEYMATANIPDGSIYLETTPV